MSPKELNSKQDFIDAIVSLEKRIESLEKELKKEKTTKKSGFTAPTLRDCGDYFKSKGYKAKHANDFWEFYEMKGWMVGKNKMKKWELAASRWIKSQRDKGFKPDLILHKPQEVKQDTGGVSKEFIQKMRERDEKKYGLTIRSTEQKRQDKIKSDAEMQFELQKKLGNETTTGFSAVGSII